MFDALRNPSGKPVRRPAIRITTFKREGTFQ